MKPFVSIEFSEDLRKSVEELSDGELRELLLVLQDEVGFDSSTADLSDEA